MTEFVFLVEEAPESGFTARALGESIYTQAETLDELREQVRDAARQWAAALAHWYNHEHRHSDLRFVAPAQRHGGEDHALLHVRDAVYQAARQRHPCRWTRATRNWTPVGPVTLNPERDALAATRVSAERHQSDKRLASGDNCLDTHRVIEGTSDFCGISAALSPGLIEHEVVRLTEPIAGCEVD